MNDRFRIVNLLLCQQEYLFCKEIEHTAARRGRDYVVSSMYCNGLGDVLSYRCLLMLMDLFRFFVNVCVFCVSITTL
jgi:hypothetical protein